MLKSFSTTLLAFALAAPLPAFAQQDDAARQKELDAARADLQRAAKRVGELSKDAGRVGSPVEIDHLIIRRPRLGVLLSGDDAAGVRITGVTPDSGAAKAGLKAGDRLLRVHGETVNGSTGDARVAHARKLLADLQAETPVRVTYQRGGKTYDASVTPTEVSPRVAFAGQGPGTFFFRTGESGMPWIDGAPMPMGEIATVIAPEVQRELRQLGRLGDCKGEDCRLPALAEAFRWSNLNLATVDASLGRYFGTENGVRNRQALLSPNSRIVDALLEREPQRSHCGRDRVARLRRASNAHCDERLACALDLINREARLRNPKRGPLE